MVIAECVIGSDVRVTDSDFDDVTRLRLRELGLGRGARARIIQRAPFGGRVLSVAGQRIALDRDTTRRVAVEPVAEPEPAALPVPAALASRPTFVTGREPGHGVPAP